MSHILSNPKPGERTAGEWETTFVPAQNCHWPREGDLLVVLVETDSTPKTLAVLLPTTNGSVSIDDETSVLLWSEMQANAALMRAAPRMLVALKRLVRPVNPSDLKDCYSPDWQEAFDAIDAAEGRSPNVR